MLSEGPDSMSSNCDVEELSQLSADAAAEKIAEHFCKNQSISTKYNSSRPKDAKYFLHSRLTTTYVSVFSIFSFCLTCALFRTRVNDDPCRSNHII